MGTVDPATPLLVVTSAKETARWRKILTVVTVTAYLVYYGPRFVVGSRLIPGTPLLDVLGRFGGIALVIGSLWFARRHVKQRTGTVTFYDDRIEVVKGVGVSSKLERVNVSWTDLAGYRDEAHDFVQLMKNDRSAPPLLGIPTPTEDDRTRVLALLDARALRRIES